MSKSILVRTRYKHLTQLQKQHKCNSCDKPYKVGALFTGHCRSGPLSDRTVVGKLEIVAKNSNDLCSKNKNSRTAVLIT